VIKQRGRDGAKAAKEAHPQIVRIDACQKFLDQRAILGVQTAQAHGATTEVDQFRAFPGGDVSARPGLCVDRGAAHASEAVIGLDMSGVAPIWT
jgi:hypothetical protein